MPKTRRQIEAENAVVFAAFDELCDEDGRANPIALITLVAHIETATDEEFGRCARRLLLRDCTCPLCQQPA